MPSRTLSRRTALRIAGGGAAGLVLAACGDSGSSAKPTATVGTSTRTASTTRPSGSNGTVPPGSGAFEEPPVILSVNGLLDVTLRAAPAMVRHAGKSRWAITINGTSPGPTLRIRPGDKLRIVFDNQLAHSTNLHTHGLRVSPTGNADNPFIEIKAGEKFTYEMQIPSDHPSGLFWYHPHLHHHVAEQIFAGMFGAIIVEDAIDRLSELAGATERMVLIHDTRDATTESGVTSATMMDQMEGRQGSLILVNGIANQAIPATSGKLERWRLLNASASRFYRLKLEGHSLNVIARDGGRLSAPEQVDELTLVPGERTEVLVQPVKEGAFRLSSLPVSRGAMGASSELQLITMNVAPGESKAPALPAKLATVADVTGVNVIRTRDVSLEMRTGGGPPRFLVSGKEFDPDRIDVQVKLGTVEDWVVRNVGPMDHPFHLHIWPFQVMEQSAQGLVPRGWKDVVNVPAGGFVRIRIPFEQLGGKTVFHCHILDHEDQGMMAVIEAS